MKRIALVGPDGAGKTTICTELNHIVPDSDIVHVVKDREHHLKIMHLVVIIWKIIPTRLRILSYLYKYIILYSFEYIENMYRVKYFSEKYKVLFYDRHPLDRVMNYYEYKYQYCLGLLSMPQYFFHVFFTKIWSHIYCKFFPSIDCVFFLLPEPELSYERSNRQYINSDYARARIAAYWKTSKVYKNTKYTIFINENKTVKEITDIIIKKI
jgi:thymidylate kinase